MLHKHASTGPSCQNRSPHCCFHPRTISHCPYRKHAVNAACWCRILASVVKELQSLTGQLSTESQACFHLRELQQVLRVADRELSDTDPWVRAALMCSMTTNFTARPAHRREYIQCPLIRREGSGFGTTVLPNTVGNASLEHPCRHWQAKLCVPSGHALQFMSAVTQERTLPVCFSGDCGRSMH